MYLLMRCCTNVFAGVMLYIYFAGVVLYIYFAGVVLYRCVFAGVMLQMFFCWCDAVQMYLLV